MKKLLSINILIILALLFSSCGDMFNEESEETAVSEPVSKAADESEEASHEIIYTPPDVQIPEEPEYDLSTYSSTYSPLGTEGATKIIIRYEDVGDTIDSSVKLNYNTEITDVYIEDGITTIGSGAFYGCTNMKTVRLPKTLKSLENRCFMECASLEAIYIPEGVQTIPYGTFAYCNSLKTVSLPEGLLEIGIDAFRGTAITEIKLPSTLKSLGKFTLPFDKIKVLELPDNIEHIEYLDCEAVFVTKNSTTHWLLTHVNVAPSSMKIIFKQSK